MAKLVSQHDIQYCTVLYTLSITNETGMTMHQTTVYYNTIIDIFTGRTATCIRPWELSSH